MRPGAADWEIVVNDSLFVPAYEGGIVLDQLPKGGVEVKAGRKVYVTINSFRQKMVKVPYVAGRSLRQAKNMLELAGLGIERLVYVEDMATNYVLEEYCDGVQILPESSMQAEMGSGVTLNVGVEGGYGITGVPKLIGQPLHRAKSRLWELGLNVGKVSYDGDVDLLDRIPMPCLLPVPRIGQRMPRWDRRLRCVLRPMPKRSRAAVPRATVPHRPGSMHAWPRRPCRFPAPCGSDAGRRRCGERQRRRA